MIWSPLDLDCGAKANIDRWFLYFSEYDFRSAARKSTLLNLAFNVQHGLALI